MGAVAGESGFSVVRNGTVGEQSPGQGTLDAAEVTALAKRILDKEPAEIRKLLRSEPEVVHEWMRLLKQQPAGSNARPETWTSALDFIRLSTLSPLRFAAE